MVYDRVVYTAVLVMLVVGCGDTSTSETKKPKPSVTWQSAFDAEQVGAFLSVWGTSSSDVWTVGGPDMKTGRVWHFDGEKWDPVQIDDGPLFNWVHGAGSVMWMVGNEGRILRRQGSGRIRTRRIWSRSKPMGRLGSFGGRSLRCWGRSTHDGRPGPHHPAFQRRPMESRGRAGNGTVLQSFVQVWGTSPTNVYAVGANR